MNHPHPHQYPSDEHYERTSSNQRPIPQRQYSSSGHPKEPFIENTPSLQHTSRTIPSQPWYTAHATPYIQDAQRQPLSPQHHAPHGSAHPVPPRNWNDHSQFVIPPQNPPSLEYRYGAQSVAGPSTFHPMAERLPDHAPGHQSTRNQLGSAQSQHPVHYIREQSYANTSPTLYYDLSDDVAPELYQPSASYPVRPGAFAHTNSGNSYYGMNHRLNTSTPSLGHPSTTSPIRDSPVQQHQMTAPYPIPSSSPSRLIEMSLDPSRGVQQSRPHTCDECGLSFVRGHDLKRHRETHKNIRPYLCNCGKSFTRKDALKRHRSLKGCGTGGSSPGSGGGYSTGEE